MVAYSGLHCARIAGATTRKTGHAANLLRGGTEAMIGEIFLFIGPALVVLYTIYTAQLLY